MPLGLCYTWTFCFHFFQYLRHRFCLCFYQSRHSWKFGTSEQQSRLDWSKREKYQYALLHSESIANYIFQTFFVKSISRWFRMFLQGVVSLKSRSMFWRSFSSVQNFQEVWTMDRESSIGFGRKGTTKTWSIQQSLHDISTFLQESVENTISSGRFWKLPVSSHFSDLSN